MDLKIWIVTCTAGLPLLGLTDGRTLNFKWWGLKIISEQYHVDMMTIEVTCRHYFVASYDEQGSTNKAKIMSYLIPLKLHSFNQTKDNDW